MPRVTVKRWPGNGESKKRHLSESHTARRVPRRAQERIYDLP